MREILESRIFKFIEQDHEFAVLVDEDLYNNADSFESELYADIFEHRIDVHWIGDSYRWRFKYDFGAGLGWGGSLFAQPFCSMIFVIIHHIHLACRLLQYLCAADLSIWCRYAKVCVDELVVFLGRRDSSDRWC